MNAQGKVVVVTGGTRGIGRAIASAYLSRGAEVIVTGRRPPAVPLEFEGRAARFFASDVRDSEANAALVDRVCSTEGRLDVLVNNAGGSPPADAATASPRFSRAIIELNLIAPLDLGQQANRVMQDQAQGGVIINIASVSGLRPSPGTAAYGAAKAGLINLTRSLAIEWAPKVRVVGVAAGLIATEMADAHYGDEERQRRIAETIGVKRLGRPDEVANVCCFLSSPAAAYISGETIRVDGAGDRPAFLCVDGPTPP